VKEWIEKVQAALSITDRRELFKQVVLTPVLNKCFPGTAEEDAPHQLEGMIGNLADWDLNLVKRETSDLITHESEMSNLLRSTFAASARKLQVSAPLTVCVFYLSSYWVRQERSLMGALDSPLPEA